MIQAGVPPDDADEDAAGETEVSENEEEKVEERKFDPVEEQKVRGVRWS